MTKKMCDYITCKDNNHMPKLHLNVAEQSDLIDILKDSKFISAETLTNDT